MTKIHEIEFPVKRWFWQRNTFRHDLEKAALRLEAARPEVLRIDFYEHNRWLTSTFHITVKGTVRGINTFAKGLSS